MSKTEAGGNGGDRRAKKQEPKAKEKEKIHHNTGTKKPAQKTAVKEKTHLPEKSQTKPKEPPAEVVKTARQIAMEETGTQGLSPEATIVQGAMMEQPLAKLDRAGPFKDFEKLEVPQISAEIATSVLQKLCRQVKLHSFNPSMYTQHSAAWEHYEPASEIIPRIKTNISLIREPMYTAHFDEIWCPIPADSKEAESILPPTFCYVPSSKSA